LQRESLISLRTPRTTPRRAVWRSARASAFEPGPAAHAVRPAV